MKDPIREAELERQVVNQGSVVSKKPREAKVSEENGQL